MLFDAQLVQKNSFYGITQIWSSVTFNPDLLPLSYYFGNFNVQNQNLHINSFKMVYNNICHLSWQSGPPLAHGLTVIVQMKNRMTAIVQMKYRITVIVQMAD